MKHWLIALLVVLPSLAWAAGKSGTCTMGSGDNEVKVLFEVESTNALVSYEGSEDEKTECALSSNSSYDYFMNCAAEDEEETMVIRIKGSTGAMIDAEGEEIAKLKKCRISKSG